MRAFFAIPLLLVAVSATASDMVGTRDRANVDKALAGKVAGKPQSCLMSHEADGMSVHDGLVLFRHSRKLIWKNDMDGCDILREDDVLVTRHYGSARLCQGDIATVLDRGGRSGKGSCVFGEFVPYRTAHQAP